MRQVRPVIVRINADACFSDIGKILGWQWKEMPAKTRDLYDQLARRDKLRYKNELIAWQRAHPELAKAQQQQAAAAAAQNAGQNGGGGSK